MKYALIADVHGNLPALKAVLADARASGAERFILLGDYYLSMPYPNEVAQTLSSLDNSYIIRGNQEPYISWLNPSEREKWTDAQFSVLYCCFDMMTEDTRKYFIDLPDVLEINDLHGKIYARHFSGDFFGGAEIETLRKLHDAYPPGKRGDIAGDLKSRIKDNAEFAGAVKKSAPGVYTFGHTHTQWHAFIGESLLINPGSCGLPTDMAPGAPYTLLTSGEEGWRVEERRVPYDKPALIKALKDSPLYRKARVWSEIMIMEIEEEREYLAFFFRCVEEYAAKTGDKKRPYTHKTWEGAYNEFIKSLKERL